MDALLDVLQLNEMVVYFAYGQAFFVLGLAVALHSRESRRSSRLSIAVHLGWLGGFGIIHAFYEWGNAFIPIQAPYLAPIAVTALRLVQFGFLVLSFFLLLQFGLLVTLAPSKLRRVFRVAPLILLAGVLGLLLASSGGASEAEVLAGAEAWTRRLLALPGAALAGYGVLRQANTVEEFRARWVAPHFRLAAVSLGTYAILAGLAIPQADPLGSQWPNFRLVIDLFGIPVPILRSIASLGVAVGIVRGLKILEVEKNSLLERAERRRFEAAERARLALDTIASTVSQQLELGKLLDAALARVLSISQSPTGWIMLSHGAAGSMTVGACQGPIGRPGTGLSCSCRPECACAQVFQDGLATAAPGGGCYLWPAGALPFGFVGVPLLARERVVGILCLALPDQRGFGSEDLGLLVSIGRQIGLAVENARLWEEIRRKEEVRSNLLKRAINAQEEERRRVALELHDETGQSLTAVIMGLGAARRVLDRDTVRAGRILEETRELAVGALQGVRELMLGLRPASLDDLGLLPALSRLGDELGRRARVDVRVDAKELNRRLPAEIETVIFRIVQEGLNNIGQHAGARHATLRLSLAGREVIVVLEDDGVGFDPPSVNRRPGGLNRLGLLGMQERASLLGGEVVVESAPGQGTRISLRLPFEDSTVGGIAAHPMQPVADRANDVAEIVGLETKGRHEANLEAR